MIDNIELNKDDINKNLKFYFVASKMLYNIQEIILFGKKPVTPTKVQKNFDFLKRSLNDFLFTPKLAVRKNP